MNFQEITAKLQEKWPEGIQTVTDQVGDPYIFIPANKVVEIIEFLKKEPGFEFDCLSNITGVDAPPDNLDIVYHLFSYSQRHSLTLKARVPKTSPDVPSLDKVYGTANWQEREAFDLLGIQFKGHSDLRRIMLPDDWEGHPLRKDYKEAEEYRGIDTTRPSLLH